ncbi:MAG: hypothetical protein Q9182_001327 [Xanthomendoza sp. 2 TL-2023]
MLTFKPLLITLPFILHTTAAYWYVDFYDKGCEDGAKPATGVMTLSGKDGEEQSECRGGAMYSTGPDDNNPQFNSRSVGINGISGSGLVVDLYAARGCPKESFITSIAGDDCFTSSKGDPVNYAIVHKG